MAWRIALMEYQMNPVSEACAEHLAALKGHHIEVRHGSLLFDKDHAEHMDYLADPDVQTVLAEHRVTGMVTFGCLEGDDFGEFWGYQFDDGKLTPLVGTVSWHAVGEPVVSDEDFDWGFGTNDQADDE